MTARRVLLLVFIFLQCTPMVFAQTQTQGLSATAKVLPNASSFHLSSTSSTNNPIPQDTQTTYTITFGSSLSYAAPITIKASWTRGTVSGSFTPSVDTASYIIGSGTTSFGASPVIDTVNRTITWTISSFPANTQNQTVSFKLQTTGAYTNTDLVNFDVDTDMTGDSVTVPQTTIHQKYQFDPSLVTPTPNPTAAPTKKTSPTPTLVLSITPKLSPTTTLTPTPTAKLKQTVTPSITPALITKSIPFAFSTISVQTVSANQAGIGVTTTIPPTTPVTLTLGTSPSALSQTIQSTSQPVTVNNLSPNTTYYFQASTKDTSGKAVTSDIFTFTTALPSTAPSVDLPSVTITSDSKVMNVQSTQTPQVSTPDIHIPAVIKTAQTAPTVLLPQKSTYEIQFSFGAKTPVKTAQIIARNQHVLGDSTSSFAPEAFAKDYATDMVEVRPGTFVAKVVTPENAGVYDIFVRTIDYNGNITEQKVSEIIVSRPFTVTDEHDNPIENARIFLSVYRKKINTFEAVGSYSIKNPQFTNRLGVSTMVLPPGRYRAEVSMLGFSKKNVTFTIGTSPKDGYPKVILQTQPFNIGNTSRYFFNITRDMLFSFNDFFIMLSASSRTFNLLAFTSVWMFVLLSFLAFFVKTNTHPKVGLSQISFMLHHLFSHDAKKQYIVGMVLDKKTHTPLALAKIYVIDDNTKNVLYETSSNKKGSFLLKKPAKHYHILALKDGFEPTVIYPTPTELLYVLLQANTYHSTVTAATKQTLLTTFALFFETLLLFSCITEVFLTGVFGIEKTWPFVLLSIINLLLWIYYVSLKKGKETL